MVVLHAETGITVCDLMYTPGQHQLLHRISGQFDHADWLHGNNVRSRNGIDFATERSGELEYNHWPGRTWEGVAACEDGRIRGVEGSSYH